MSDSPRILTLPLAIHDAMVDHCRPRGPAGVLRHPGRVSPRGLLVPPAPQRRRQRDPLRRRSARPDRRRHTRSAREGPRSWRSTTRTPAGRPSRAGPTSARTTTATCPGSSSRCSTRRPRSASGGSIPTRTKSCRGGSRTTETDALPLNRSTASRLHYRSCFLRPRPGQGLRSTPTRSSRGSTLHAAHLDHLQARLRPAPARRPDPPAVREPKGCGSPP